VTEILVLNRLLFPVKLVVCIQVPNAAIALVSMVVITLLSSNLFAEGATFGTGVLVNPLGHILTNRHVVEGCSSFVVRSPGFTDKERTLHRATLLASSSAFDLAILKAELPEGRVFAPLLVWENLHSFLPLDGKEIVQGGYPMHVAPEIIKVTFGYVREVPGLLQRVGAQRNSLVMEADTDGGGSGSGVFDLHGNLIGLVYARVSDEFTQKLIEASFWRFPNYGNPILFHDLDAIVKFLTESGVGFRYQIVESSKPLQGRAPVHGWVIRVTYQIVCQ
jgi:S1-C subfamily serine protease